MVKRYWPGYSFSGFEAANPTAPKPGAALDVEFAAVAKTLEDVLTHIGLGTNPVARTVSSEGSFPFSVLTTDDIVYVTCPLTAARVISLPAYASADRIDVFRTGTSTGAFNLEIRDHIGALVGTLAANISGSYARVVFDGNAFIVSYGTGAPPATQIITKRQAMKAMKANTTAGVNWLTAVQNAISPSEAADDAIDYAAWEWPAGGAMWLRVQTILNAALAGGFTTAQRQALEAQASAIT